MKYTYTRLWRINHKLIVADTIEDAIILYKAWSENTHYEIDDITKIQAIGDFQIPEDFDVLIKDN